MPQGYGLRGPKGQRARQFGEDIVEPGQEFSTETLGTIRSLLDEEQGDTSAPITSSDSHAPVRAVVQASSGPARQGPAYPEVRLIAVPDVEADEMKILKVADAVSDTAETIDAIDQTKTSSPQKSTQIEIDTVPTETLLRILEQGSEAASACDTQEETAGALEDVPNQSAEAETHLPEPFHAPMLSPEEAARDIIKFERTAAAVPAEGRISDLRNLTERARRSASGTPSNPSRSVIATRIRAVLGNPRYLALGLLVGIVVWRPWFVPGFASILTLLALLLGIVIGPARLKRFAGWVGDTYARKNPERAAELDRRLRRVKTGWRTIVAILTGRWSDELDMIAGIEDSVDHAHEEALAERFARLARDGA